MSGRKRNSMSETLRSILLVEDSPNDVELTLEALKDARLANDVVVVRDGAEALEYLFCKGAYTGRNDGDPAVVLLDLKLPKVDGLEVLSRIRREHGNPHLPVVILTSSREEQDVVRGYQLGVNAFVVKPVGFQEFFRAIQDLGVFWALLNEPPPPRTQLGR
jgi:CheY-like chemotaxis protein